MPNTYQICEVTVTLPSLGTITTDGAGNQIKRGDKCRVHLYAVGRDWRSGSIFEGFNVGAITFTGYTESPFKRSQKILMPDSYKLVALRVDDDGVPTSWDSLPVQFVGGLISLKDVDGTVRVRIGEINGAEPFNIRDGETFINNTNIANVAIHSAAIETPQPVTNIYNISLGIQRDEPAQNKVTISADKFEVKSGVDSNIEAILKNALANDKSMSELSEFVRKAIQKECQPGGAVWCMCCR